MASLSKGDTFANKFTILDCIGIGGMCEVYLAEQSTLQRRVAIKVLREELAQGPLERERFLREAQNCSKLEHVNITTIYETGVANELPYIAMEYVEGDTLENLLEKRLSSERVIRINLQVAKALDYAHKQGIVHRDLKPANILVSKQGEVKVADWGLSKREKDKSRLTKTGMVMGTPQYMAPEQILAEKTTNASDLYALGVIIYECYAGKLPFAAKDTVSILRAHLDEVPPELRKICRHCPKSISNLVTTLLAKEPHDRPSSAKEVISCLSATDPENELLQSHAKTEVVKAIGESAKKLKKESTEPKENRRSSKPFLLIFSMALLCLLLHSWFARSGKSLSEKNKAVEILSVKATKLNMLTIRFKGHSRNERLHITVLRQNSVKPVRSKHTVNLQKARSISKETSLIDFRITPFPKSTYEVTVSSSLNRISLKVDPRKEIQDVLGPIRALHKSRLDELINDVRGGNALMARARLAQSEDGLKQGRAILHKALEEGGLTEDYVKKLRQLLDDEIYLNSPLCRELAPLLLIESLISYHNTNELPWASVFEALGGSYENLQLNSDKNTLFPHHRVLRRITFGHERDNRLFISCLTGASRNFIYQVYKMGKTTYGKVLGSIPPLDKMKPAKQVAFAFDKTLVKKNTKLLLALVFRYISTEVPLFFTINRSKPYILLGSHDIRFDKPGENRLGRFFVPLDYKDFKDGENKITLFVKTLNPNLNILALKEFTGPPVVIIDEIAIVTKK